MGKNTITILTDNYENSETQEVINGVTIMIDGVLKDVLDKLRVDLGLEEMPISDLMGEVVMNGVNAMIDMAKKENSEVK